jgi:hypothetical protein
MYDLVNVFESFLPQLLTYPNPVDPLNGDAAALYLHKPEEYKIKVKDYVKKYATDEVLKDQDQKAAASSSTSAESEQITGSGETAQTSKSNTTPADSSKNNNASSSTKKHTRSSSESSMSDFEEDDAPGMEL